MNKVEFLKEHCEFITPYDEYILIAISHKKDSPEITCSNEVIFREVVRNKDQIERKYDRIKRTCENYLTDDGKKMPFYIYISCNARNAKKALPDFLTKINTALLEESNGEQRSRIFKRLDREFINSISKPSARSKNRYFMIDFDIKDRELLHSLLEDLDKITTINAVIETRNGFHIKCRPFDKRLIPTTDYYSVEPDRHLFVNYISK